MNYNELCKNEEERVKESHFAGDVKAWMERWFVRFFRHCDLKSNLTGDFNCSHAEAIPPFIARMSRLRRPRLIQSTPSSMILRCFCNLLCVFKMV